MCNGCMWILQDEVYVNLGYFGKCCEPTNYQSVGIPSGTCTCGRFKPAEALA